MAEYRSGHNGVVLKTSVSVMSWPVGSNPTSAAILHIPCVYWSQGSRIAISLFYGTIAYEVWAAVWKTAGWRIVTFSFHHARNGNFTPIKVRGETDRRLRPTQHLILCRQVYGVIPSGESPAQKRDRSNWAAVSKAGKPIRSAAGRHTPTGLWEPEKVCPSKGGQQLR